MSRRTEKNVGIIGLGIIGQRVADCVRRRGFHAFVWNRTPRPFPNFVGSPSEIAELCDFIQIFVSDDEALIEMVQQMRQTLSAHHIVLAHSTVAPHTMRAAAEIVQRRGAQLLDAPFTGSKDAAAKGELIYYIGGDEAAYRRARPILQASSKDIIEIGEIGQATTIKIATNMITAATVQAAAEALALVHSSGLTLDKFVAAMQGNGSNSGTLTMKLPKMLEGNFEPQFSVKHMLKDVRIALQLAHFAGLYFPATTAARDCLVEESRHGRDDDDYSSMVRNFFPEGTPMMPETQPEEMAQQPSLDLYQPEPTNVVWEEFKMTPDAEVPPEEVPPPVAVEEPVREEGTTRLVETDVPVLHVNGEPAGETAPVDVTENVQAMSPEPSGADTSAEAPPSEAGAETPTPEASPEEEVAAPRGFLSRLFGKGADY